MLLDGSNSKLALLPLVALLVSAPLAGWLADSKFGNFKVFKFGSISLLLSVLMDSICSLMVSNIHLSLIYYGLLH